MVETGQDLPLNRAMLSVHKTPYVGRFARDWHRLSTTEPLAAPSGILGPTDSNEFARLIQLVEARDSRAWFRAVPSRALVATWLAMPDGPLVERAIPRTFTPNRPRRTLGSRSRSPTSLLGVTRFTVEVVFDHSGPAVAVIRGRGRPGAPVPCGLPERSATRTSGHCGDER